MELTNFIEKSLIGAALVFIINHLLGHIILLFPTNNFSEGDLLVEGTIFGMLYNIPAYGMFILINGLVFTFMVRWIPNWKLTINVIVLFIIANIILGRFPWGENGEGFYYLRYAIALSSLFLVNPIVEKLSGIKRFMIILSPFAFIALIFILLSVESKILN